MLYRTATARERYHDSSSALLSLAAAVLFTAVACCAQPIVLETSTLLDGKGGTLKNQQIVIEGSCIRSIAPGKAAATYDLRGLTVMPGWIDTHVHLSWHFDANHRLVNRSEPPQTSALYTAENAWLTLQGGFTTVQSVGAAIDADVRDRVADG
jgi:imidazolonepropionase-like amidohydrolase